MNMLGTTAGQTGNEGTIFCGALGFITISIIGVMGCIPTKRGQGRSEEEPPEEQSQEREETTASGGGKCGKWLHNLYNIVCFTNPSWPCWKTALIKAIFMFLTTLGSALASLAITRLFADDNEGLEETVSRILGYVLDETSTRRRRDVDGTNIGTDQMAAIITAAVVGTAWTIATVTVIITYILNRKTEDTDTEVEGMVKCAKEKTGNIKVRAEVRMVDEDYTDEMDVTIDDSAKAVNDGQVDDGGWITWMTMVGEQLRNAMNYLTGAVNEEASEAVNE